MLEHVLGIVEIPEHIDWGVLKHEVQAVDFKNIYVKRVMFYSDHDTIAVDTSYDNPQTFCLKIYGGNKPGTPLPHTFLYKYDDGQLRELSGRSGEKLPVGELVLVRNLIRQLFEQNQISRIARKCSQCMRLDFQVAQAQRSTPQKPL